jgi:hypothetical protein
MRADTEVRAYEALSLHPRARDLATLVGEALQSAWDARSPALRPADLARRADELGIGHDDAETPCGNALDVMRRGPQNAEERGLARALAAHALATDHAADGDAERVAAEILWLALHTPFDATGLLDTALSDPAQATSIWEAIADRMHRLDSGTLPDADAGEALVGAIALASSSSPTASKLASQLATKVHDDKLSYVLTRRPEDRARASAGEVASDHGGVLVGEMAPRPRTWLATTLLGLTGISLVLNVTRVLCRVAFAYRKPAELALSEDGGLRVHWRVELLGKTLRDGEVVVPRHGLARATREVRYPSLALYTALLALVVGSYVGVSAFADGVRAGSPPLLLSGLLLVALGLGLDLVLSSLLPGARGRCRLLLMPKAGSPLCLARVDAGAADAMLARLGRS